MDKEKIITIVLGLIVGIVLAAGYFFGSKFLPNLTKQSQPTAAKTTRKPEPIKNDDQNIVLTINTPDDNSSTAEKSIKFAGMFSPNSTLILFANAGENIATSDAQGKFNFDVPLESGENEITINGFDETGKLVSAKRNITMEVTP